MEIAPGPLMRTHTAPSHARSLSQMRQPAQVPPRGPASLRPSHPPPALTATASSSSLAMAVRSRAGSVPPSESGTIVLASDNIINQAADSSKSLYQICVKLRQRLAEVPGFDRHLDEMDRDEAGDPMMVMWNCLKRGYPLLAVYNALRPDSPIEIDPAKVPEAKRPIAAAFKFSEACKKDLDFPSDECFLIKDLHGDDTTGFVKVISAVNRVVDVLQSRHLLLPPDEGRSPTATAPEPNQKRTRRDFIIGELVDTERKYVQDLESLQQFKVAVEEKGEVPGDKVHAIFLNLNALLDFQRRFLIRIETLNSLPESRQNWGQLFSQSQASFRVYEPYIANQQHGDEQAVLEFDKLQNVGHRITTDRATLSGFLMKPFQRLSKYPLLLKELRDRCDAEPHIKDDLTAGINAAVSILERANAALDKEQRLLAVEELQGQVDDWKGHDLDQFGELMLYGTFAVVKTDGRNDVEKDYRIYLFQRILLCCKENNPSKQKNNLSFGMNRPQAADRSHRARPKMQLKGRIFMQNVTETLSLSKPGSYTVQIFWKGDPGVENFVIRFQTEDLMKRWYAQVETQRKAFADRRTTSSIHLTATPSSSDTSDAEFVWQRTQGVPQQNPYKQDEDEDEDDDDDDDNDEGGEDGTRRHDDNDDGGGGDDDDDQSRTGTMVMTTSTKAVAYGANRVARSETSTISRNTSSASLRLRPPTGDGSGTRTPPLGTTRLPPPRFPMGQMPPPQLTLHTQVSNTSAPSPAERAAAAAIGASYFSPTAESPASTRASSSSGFYPFPRQSTPLGHWPGDEPTRYTAPAVGRTVSREGPPSSSSSSSTRPSLPAMANREMPAAALAQNRLRSASSPDIHNHGPHGRRLPNGEHTQPHPPVPEVPPFPPNMALKKAPINRSHTNSPVDGPKRIATQSPGIHRDRLGPPGSSSSGGGGGGGGGGGSNMVYPQHLDPRSTLTSANLTPTPTAANVGAAYDPRLRSLQAHGSTTTSPLTSSSTIASTSTIMSSSTAHTSGSTAKASRYSGDKLLPTPTQLKVKVSFENNYVTLVVAMNISYQSLVDRIDAKLSRFTKSSIGRGTIRLRYMDEDGDFVTIRSDEDILMAFSDWREQLQRSHLLQQGQLGEIQLYCQGLETQS